MNSPEHVWLIWSNEHKAWWRENSAGYTPDRKDAGRYTFVEATEILKGANSWQRETKNTPPQETMCPDW